MQDEVADKQVQLNRLLRFQDANKAVVQDSKATYDQLLKQAQSAELGRADFIREPFNIELGLKRRLATEEFNIRRDIATKNLEIKNNEIEQERSLRLFEAQKQIADLKLNEEQARNLIAGINKKFDDQKVAEAKKTVDEISAYEVDAAKKVTAAKIATIQQYSQYATDLANVTSQTLQAINQNELNNIRSNYDKQFQANQEQTQQQLNAELAAADKSNLTEEQKNAKKQTIIDKYNKKKADADKKTNEQMLKEENKVREKQFKAEKALNIAKAVINGAQAITSILAQYPKFDGGFAMAAAIAASVVTTAAQVAVIASQEYTPEGQGQPKELTVPDLQPSDAAQQSGVNQGGFTLFNPENVNVTSTGGRNTTGGGMNPLRVYVLESDITDAQRRVKTTVEQASFG